MSILISNKGFKILMLCFYLPCNSSLCLLYTFITHFHTHLSFPWGFLLLFNKKVLWFSLMRINKLPTLYFEFRVNNFLETALFLIFDVFTLFGGIFLCSFSFSIVSFDFPYLHWIQYSAICIPVLDIKMHRCQQFLLQFLVSTKLSFNI